MVSLTGVYNFTKTNLTETQFEETTGKDFVYNLAPTDDPFLAKLFKVDVSKIARHVLMKRFTVTASYMFIDDVDMKRYRTEYSFDVRKFIRTLPSNVNMHKSTGSIVPTRDSLEV